MTSRREAEAFARCLTGRPCGRERAARYAAACTRLAPEERLTPAERNILRTAVRLPWLAGPLDAACGVLQPAHPLRARMFIMAAVLEASPEGARDFLPASASRPALMVLTAAGLAKAAVKLLLGLAVFPLARGRWLTS